MKHLFLNFFRPLLLISLLTSSALGLSTSALARGPQNPYRLGDEWGKSPVTAEMMNRETPVFRRTALATARYGGATGFYLGKFNGHHVVATNHHVQSSMYCGGAIDFTLLGKKFACAKVFGHWSAIDLALIAIRVAPADEAILAPLARGFSYETSIYPGQALLTIGFGVQGNSQRVMMAGQDSDCKVFSGVNEFRFMGDPDEFNPGDYQAWSFANGCDGSHGDSGSAFVDRHTGDVLGLIWTGRIPKSSSAQNSAYLDQLFRSHGAEIWQELTYAVPAAKIREHLVNVVNGPDLDEDTRSTLAEVIR